MGKSYTGYHGRSLKYVGLDTIKCEEIPIYKKMSYDHYYSCLSNKNSFLMDKLKARLVANGSQQGRHLYNFSHNLTSCVLTV